MVTICGRNVSIRNHRTSATPGRTTGNTGHRGVPFPGILLVPLFLTVSQQGLRSPFNQSGGVCGTFPAEIDGGALPGTREHEFAGPCGPRIKADVEERPGGREHDAP